MIIHHQYTLENDRKEEHVLVLGSSFNPPTNAHLGLLTASINLLGETISHVLLLIASNNPDKPAISDQIMKYRTDMMDCIAQDLHSTYPFLTIMVVSTPHGMFIDQEQDIRSTLLTVKKIYFIMGYDTLVRFFDKKYYTSISMSEVLSSFFMNGNEILCAERPLTCSILKLNNDSECSKEIRDQSLQSFMSQDDTMEFAQYVREVSVDKDLSDLSSSKVRLLLSMKSETEYASELTKLLPSNVYHYVTTHHIYSP